jgi:hypothetical protein
MTRLKTIHQESTMENQIVIQSPDGTFRAYISRPAKLPAPAVVVLQELPTFVKELLAQVAPNQHFDLPSAKR